MKVVLAVLCILMVLFSGGCALMFGGNGGSMQLALLVVLALNCAVLAALFGWLAASPGMFYSLAILDFIAAIGFAIAAFSTGSNDQTVVTLGILLVGGFALKGLLTLLYIRANPS
jgi:hypothetical protein